VLAARVSVMHEKPESRLSQGTFGSIPTEFRESFRALTADRYSVVALAQLITSSTLVLLFAILIPRYMKDVSGAARPRQPDRRRLGKRTRLCRPDAVRPRLAAAGAGDVLRRSHGALLCVAQRPCADGLARAGSSSRIFATQVVSANFISLIPLLLIGAVTDIFNVTVVLLMLAAAVGGMAAVSPYMGTHEEHETADERTPEGART
jgi:hypothetical protein